MKVKVLDEKVIGLVAAGEVIDSPSNIVKELVENSIDANSKSIKIEIFDDKDLIKISDDGEGFSKEDIPISFKKHATSKINRVEDLYMINSYGFRGEALPSIAAVSKVTLISRKKDIDFGYKYVIEYGEEKSFEKCPANVGTSFEISDIFSNYPVRKKFLKSPSKENALIIDLIYKFSISKPEIMFEVYYNEKLKYKTNGDGTLKNVLYSIYGTIVFDNLIEVKKDLNGLSILGYIAKPVVARNNKDDLLYFVNGRIVRHKIIDKAIIDAYSGYFMKNKYPLVVLNIDIEPSFVDVNIHPKKTEIKFNNDETIYLAVYDLINNTLKNSNLIFSETLINKDISNDRVLINEKTIEQENYYTEHLDNRLIRGVNNFIEQDKNDLVSQIVNSSIENTKNIDDLPSLSDLDKGTSNNSVFAKIKTENCENYHTGHPDNNLNRGAYNNQTVIKETIPEIARDYRLIGQIFKTYILIEFNDKLYIIDQHAAHEKINYEKLINAYKNNEVVKQNIYPPIIIRLNQVKMVNVKKCIDEFDKLGFEIELFGDLDIRVSAIPYSLIDIQIKDVICEMIDELDYASNVNSVETIVDKLATTACKKSVKANMVLSELQIDNLIKDLFKLDDPFNCPHGRPTIIELSKNEFEKKFGRIV